MRSLDKYLTSYTQKLAKISSKYKKILSVEGYVQRGINCAFYVEPERSLRDATGLFWVIRESDTPSWTLKHVDMNYVANVHGPKNKPNVYNFWFVSVLYARNCR